MAQTAKGPPIRVRRGAMPEIRGRIRVHDLIMLWTARVIIWGFLLFSLFPTLYVISASFRKGDAFLTGDVLPTFSDLTFRNYVELFTKTRFPIWLKNSTIVAVSTGLLQLLLTATAAYAFSRMKFWGRRHGLMVLLILQMFPSILSLSAIFFMWAKLGLTDSLLGLILALGGTQAFNIWLLKGYFDNITRELDEAAMVDGASTWAIFWKIMIPLSRPFLAVLFMWTFLGNFTEFTITSVLNKNPQAYTLALGLRQFVTNQFTTRWTIFAAASVVICVPLVTIWIYLQKHLIAGLTRGAIKG